MPLTNQSNLSLKNYYTPTSIAGVAPTLDYRFSLDRREIEAVSLTDKLTVSRTGPSTFVDQSGYTLSAQENTPRFTHDPITKKSLGLIVESSRTNLRSNSNTSFYRVIGSFLFDGLSNDIISPSGSNVTYKVVSDGSGQDSIDIAYGQITLTAGVTYTFSSYYYATSTSSFGRTIGLKVFGNGSAYSGYVTLPLNTWTRRSLTFTASSTNSSGQLRVIDNDTNGFNTTYGATIYLWGAQIEVGSGATSYIPTSGSSATRSSESVIIDGTGVLVGSHTIVDKPAGCVADVLGNLQLQPGYTAERIMVFPTALTSNKIAAIREAM